MSPFREKLNKPFHLNYDTRVFFNENFNKKILINFLVKIVMHVSRVKFDPSLIAHLFFSKRKHSKTKVLLFLFRFEVCLHHKNTLPSIRHFCAENYIYFPYEILVELTQNDSACSICHNISHSFDKTC